MENNSSSKDSESKKQTVDTSEYNSPGVIFSKSTPHDGEDSTVTQSDKKSQQANEQANSGGQKEVPLKYSNKIQSLRTYEKDLEEAKRRAGIDGAKKKDASTARKTKKSTKSVPAAPTDRARKTLKRQVEQELAKSGIMPQAEKDAPPAKK